MRSIGAWKIKKLKAIVQEECGRNMETYQWRDNTYEKGMALRTRIKVRIPSEWYDTWEMAYAEINRLVDDFINAYQYGSVR
jgi:hypothetical protein